MHGNNEADNNIHESIYINLTLRSILHQYSALMYIDLWIIVMGLIVTMYFGLPNINFGIPKFRFWYTKFRFWYTKFRFWYTKFGFWYAKSIFWYTKSGGIMKSRIWNTKSGFGIPNQDLVYQI